MKYVIGAIIVVVLFAVFGIKTASWNPGAVIEHTDSLAKSDTSAAFGATDPKGNKK